MFARIAILASVAAVSLGAAQPPIDLPEPSPIHPWVQACENWDEWDKPGPPFKVHGNTWYVGTCGIAAILVVGEDGLVLLDSGTQAGADIVAENIAVLGFDVADVKALLASHEHFDHVGGMAKLQALTGATVYAGWGGSAVLRSGKADPRDPQFGTLPDMAPVASVRSVKGGESAPIAGVRFTAIATPGHTPGAMSWSWESCEGADCRTMVYADSLSAVSADGYRFTDHPEYLAAFEQSLERVGALECDILLTPHPSAAALRERLQDPQLGFRIGQPCRDYARKQAAMLRLRLLKERGETNQ